MTVDEIRRIRAILEQQIQPEPERRPEGDEQVSFKETLKRFAEDVNNLQLDAEDETQKLVAGDVENLHQVMVGMSEADASFRLMMEMRNKILEAYREIMRMQV